MTRRLALTLAGPLCAVLAAPSAAWAETDWFASLYTNEGVELRADERVFALYAILNAMGYDEAPILRQYPVPAREMHPIRLKVRAGLRLDSTEEEKLGAFFDAHRQPAEAYARWALSLKGPPRFERTSAIGAEAKGLETLLSDVWSREKIGELFASVQDEYRSSLKGYHAVVDAPVGAARRLLKMREDEAPRVVLVVNLLDAKGKSFSVLEGEELYVVLGPSKSPDLFSVVREVARAKLEPLVAAKSQGMKGLAEVAASAEADSPAAFATEALARAFAATALGLSESELEAYARGGWAPVRELAKSVEAFPKSDKSLEAFVVAGLASLSKEKEPAKDAAATPQKKSP